MSQIKWTNTSGGDFNTGANWMGGAVPGAGDDALLTTVGTYTVTSSANETVSSLQIVQNVTLSITNNTFYAINGTGSGTNAGLIAVGNNTNFEAGGTIAGTGTLQLNSSGNSTSFILETASVTLSGGGKVILGDSANNFLYGAVAADTLVNVSDTISGAGHLGDNQMSLNNQAGGTINATSAANALILQLGAGTGTNAGLIEATGVAGLSIVGSSITQTGTGTLKAVGAGVAVNLTGGVVISGGTLATSGGGVIQVAASSTAELSGVTIAAAGVVNLTNNTALRLDGTITNKGTITLSSIGNSTDLIVNTGTATLTGGGKVVMSDGPNNRIYGAASSAPFNTLVNVNNTISGSGQIGVNQMILVNQAAGIINATGTAAGLTISLGTFTNAGLVEDTNIAGLGITGAVVTNTGTLGAFGAGTTVNLYNGTDVIGGTLATSGGGVVETTSTATLDGSGAAPITITAGSEVLLNNNTSIQLRGSIVNHGTISLGSLGNSTDLIMGTPTVTLSGGGKVVMTDNSNNRLYGSVGGAPFNTLVNVDNTIIGSGQVGAGQLSVINQVSGIINSTGTQGLTINTGSGGFTNAGLIEDTGKGGVGISATVVTNSGTILATGSLATVNFYGGSVVKGGTLTANAGGVLETTNSATLDGSGSAITLTTGTAFDITNNTQLALLGSIVNRGTIALQSGGNATNLISNAATVTLSGGGTVLLSDNANNQIYGAATANVLVNVDNTIVGSGRIGAGQGSFINQAAGIINSSGNAGLTIATGGGSFSNAGLIEDTGSGGLGISATSIANTGTIGAFGVGATVNFYNGAVEVGGLLTASGGGLFETSNFATLDGTGAPVTIAANTAFDIVNNTQLTLLGSIVNHGTLAVQSGGNGTNLISGTATVTLSGGGTVLLSDNVNNQIYGAATTNVLVNADNTIVGSGRLGAAQGSFVNQSAGVINSNGNAGLTISTGGGSFSNAGLIEDTGTGGVGITGGSTTIVNTGTIGAFGAGTSVNIYSGAIVSGGKLATSGGGIFETSNFGTLDGTAGALTLTTGSQFVVVNNTSLYLQGAIVNQGTIGVDSGGNGTFLLVNSPTVTLSGGGSVLLTDNVNNYFYGVATADKLVNAGNTIAGAGHLGDGQLTLDNQAHGTIDATGSNKLVISLGSTFTNEGLVEGGGSGGLLIQNATLTNTGVIAALSASTATIDATTTITNYGAGTLTGGTWEAIAAAGTTSTLSIAAGTITVDAAKLVFSGAGASIVAGGTAVASTLKTITSKGELDIQNGAVYADPSTLANGGKILLSGSLSATGITNTPTGSITANGGLGSIGTTGKLTNNGLLQATSGGTLQLSKGTVTNAGSIVAQAGGKVTLIGVEKNSNLVAGVLTGGNWEALGAGATLAVQDGTITSDAATLTLSGAGSVIASEKTNVALEATLGTIAAGGILNVLNGRGFASTFAGGINDLGTFAMGGGTVSGGLTIGSGAVFDGTGTISGAVTDNGLLLSSIVPAGSTGTLSLSSALHGTGTLEAGASTTLATAGYTIGAVTIDAGGTLTGAGTVSGAVSDAGALVLAGGTLAAGSVTIAAGASLSGFGTVNPGIADSGTISASGGLLLLASASGTGSASIASGATLDSTAALSVAGVGFTGVNETLALGTPAGNTAVISGFGSGDTIDLLNTVITSFTYNTTTGNLVLKNGTSTLGSLKFAGSYAKTNFGPVSDGHGGTDILFVPSAVADLHGAVAATAGSAAAAGLSPAAPALMPSPQAAPELGFSLHHDAGMQADGLMMHLPAVQ